MLLKRNLDTRFIPRQAWYFRVICGAARCYLVSKRSVSQKVVDQTGATNVGCDCDQGTFLRRYDRKE
jgi:hypothetical protein